MNTIFLIDDVFSCTSMRIEVEPFPIRTSAVSLIY